MQELRGKLMAHQKRESYLYQGSESLKLVLDAERHSSVSVLLVLSFQKRNSDREKPLGVRWSNANQVAI
jgi:hypothetical protein